jgi:hypothetical protein
MFFPPVGSQLDASSPFANRLVAYFPLTDGGGKYAVNLARGPVQDGTLWTLASTKFIQTQMGTCGHTEGAQMVDMACNLPPTYPVTISAWVKHTTINVNSYVAWGQSAQELVLLNVSGAFWALSEQAGNAQAVSTTTAVNGRWYHVVGVWTDATLRDIYVNGRWEGTDTNSRTPSSASPAVRFGQRFGANQPLDGELQNIAIWSRALQATEIAYLYANPWTMLLPNQPRYASLPAIIPTPTGANPVARFDRIRSRRTSW